MKMTSIDLSGCWGRVPNAAKSGQNYGFGWSRYVILLLKFADKVLFLDKGERIINLEHRMRLSTILRKGSKEFFAQF